MHKSSGKIPVKVLPKTIYLLRHGETRYNREGIVQGSGVDSELNQLGTEQARAFHHTYGHLPFELVLTSALRRTQQTVGPFIDKGIPWLAMPELNEISWGDLEGQAYDNDGRKHFHQVTDAWRKGHLDARIPNGESAAELAERLRRFADHLHQRPESLLLVCSHGRTMRGLLCVLLNRSLRRMDEFAHHNTGLWRIHFDASGEPEVDMRNDLQHLLHHGLITSETHPDQSDAK